MLYGENALLHWQFGNHYSLKLKSPRRKPLRNWLPTDLLHTPLLPKSPGFLLFKNDEIYALFLGCFEGVEGQEGHQDD